MAVKKTFAALPATTLSLLALTGCGTSQDDAPVEPTPSVSAPAASAPVESAPAESPAAEAPAPAPAAPAAANELPANVTGYTDEARSEMADEGVTEADVEGALAAAHRGEAEVEWDDDGYWEIEWGEIEIDIDPNGLVRDADR